MGASPLTLDFPGKEIPLRKLLVLSVVAAFFGTLVAASLAGGAAARSVAHKTLTLHLVEKQVGFNYIDNPPKGGPNEPPLIGDEFAFTSELQTTSGARAGELNAMCMVSRGGVNATGPCYGLFSLKGGTIAGMALLSQTNTTIIAIVGGTGAYEGVTGSVKSVSRGDNSPYTDDTMHLVYPS